MAKPKKASAKKSKDQLLFDKYLEQMQNSDLVSAVQTLDELADITTIKSFVYTLKVDVLSQLGRQQEALDAAELAVQYPNPSSKLYKLRAELLMALGQSTEDIQKALNSIDQALNFYDQESMNEDIQAQFNDVDSFKFWFSEKTKSRTEMASLKADIKSLLYALNVQSQVQDIQNNLLQEKIKTIELMAVFTAILALIFANVQFFSKLNLKEIVIANGSLALAMTWMLWIIQRISLGKSFLPVPDFKKLLGAVILLCFSLSLITGTAYVVIIFLRWLF
jgi:hypothetical protein